MKSPFKDVRCIGSDISQEVYRRQEQGIKRGDPRYIMSRGELVSFSRCPLKWVLGEHDDEDTKSTLFGSLVDTMLLMPQEFSKLFVIRPQTYESTHLVCPKCGSTTDSPTCKKCKVERESKTVDKPWNENSAICSDWTEARQKEGKTVIRQEMFDDAGKALERVAADKRLIDFVNCSQKQVMIVATYVDSLTKIEVPLKILIDLVPDKNHPKFRKSLADLKTCRDSSKHAFKREVSERGYDVQSALYSDLYQLAFPDEERIEWRWLLVENSAPFITGRRIETSDFMELGRAKYLAALRDYCACLATDAWPSHDDHGEDSMDGWSFVAPEAWMVDGCYGMNLQDSLKPAKPFDQSSDYLAGA